MARWAFRLIVENDHPDHETIATFAKRFWREQFWTYPASAERYASLVVAKGVDNPATIVQSFVTQETSSMGLITVLDSWPAITFPTRTAI